MKRYALLAAILAIAVLPATAQNLDEQIASAQKDLANRLQTRDQQLKEWAGLKQKKDDIDFAWAAAQKQEGVLLKEVDDFKMRKDALSARYDALKPQLDSYNAAVTAHNDHQCTEKCSNGSCDGSCAWYNAEKQRLDSQKASLEAAYAPLDAQTEKMKTEFQQLQTNAGLIEQIKQNVYNDTQTWAANIKGFKARVDENEGQIDSLTKLIARLLELKTKYETCVRAIPPECDRPDVIGPDGKPILNTHCEQAKAQCSTLFDGNRVQ